MRTCFIAVSSSKGRYAAGLTPPHQHLLKSKTLYRLYYTTIEKYGLCATIQAHHTDGACPSPLRIIPHSTQFSGGVCPHSSKASRREDLEVEEPVACGYCAAFHFHPASTSM